MNNQEARLILQAYRPGGQDASDPLMAEALEQAARDPELQKWFAEEQARDLRIQARLRSAVVAPPELKANLLALQKMSQTRPRRGWPMWLAAAALIMALLAISALWLRPAGAAQLDAFRKAMVQYSMNEREHVSFEASDMAKIQNWLASRGAKADFELPAGLDGKPAQGCRVLDWNGQKATLICFMLSGRQHVDLFVMDRAGLPRLPDNSTPQFFQNGPLMTVTWSKNNRVYVLTSRENKEFLQTLLQQS